MITHNNQISKMADIVITISDGKIPNQKIKNKNF